MFDEILHDPFSLIVLVIVGGGFLSALIYQIRVRTGGIEAEAVITWIETKSEYNGETHYTYDEYHVQYRTKDGRYIDAELSNQAFGAQEGDLIRIKYIPGHEERPVYLSRL